MVTEETATRERKQSKTVRFSYWNTSLVDSSPASKKITMISSVLRLSETISNAALRMYTLAVEHKFTKGRKSLNVVAVCLYIACRQKDTHTHMLIDFSDLLQVCYLVLAHGASLMEMHR
jgi:transcription initiation factor TFIIIB Brf1 subunit/transcription initiation factor TFIIB